MLFIDRVRASAEGAAAGQPLRVEASRSIMGDWSTVRVSCDAAGRTFCAFRFARRDVATKVSLLSLQHLDILPVPRHLEDAAEAAFPLGGGWILYVGNVDHGTLHEAAAPLWELSRSVVGLTRNDGRFVLDLLPSLFVREKHLDPILARFVALSSWLSRSELGGDTTPR